MKLISSLDELIENIMKLDGYRLAQGSEERRFYLDLMKKGACFISYKTAGSDIKYFAPSRFVGYVGNDMDMHNKNEQKDGKETNPAITRILKQDVPGALDDGLEERTEFEPDYLRLCGELGVTPYNKAHKFWGTTLNISR